MNKYHLANRIIKRASFWSIRIWDDYYIIKAKDFDNVIAEEAKHLIEDRDDELTSLFNELWEVCNEATNDSMANASTIEYREKLLQRAKKYL